MASELNYITAAEVRNRCIDVDTSDYSDAELDVIITNKENRVHYMLGRATSSPYTTADDEFEIVKDAVLEYTACEVFGGIDGASQHKTDACAAGDEAIAIITKHPSSAGGIGAGGTISKTQGFNYR